MRDHAVEKPQLLLSGTSACVLLMVACATSSKPTSKTLECTTSPDAWCAPAACATPGGPAPGPPDTHCGGLIQPTSEAVCAWDGGGPDRGPPSYTDGGVVGPATVDAGGIVDAGGAGTKPADAGREASGVDDGSCGGPFGPASYGHESDDDDCKYHVTWASTPICERAPLSFTVTVAARTDGAPVTGATPYLEVYKKGCTHATPAAPCACTGDGGSPTAVEGPPGTYTLGPYFLDEAGTWLLRYHLRPTCTDNSAASPHGHAAYWVDVP